MSIATVVTRGFGSFGSVAEVVTRGYLAAPVEQPEPVPARTYKPSGRPTYKPSD